MWSNNQSIHFKLGSVALWGLLTKRVIDARSPTLAVLKGHFDRRGELDVQNDFVEMTTRELPTSMQEREAKVKAYAEIQQKVRLKARSLAEFLRAGEARS